MNRKLELSKKKLLGAITVFALLCMVSLLWSNKKLSVDAAQSGTVSTRKLLDSDTYGDWDSNALVGVFEKEDGSAYTVVKYDGSTLDIDNADRNLERVYPVWATGGVGYQMLNVYDTSGKHAYMDWDGNYLAEDGKFYDTIGFLNDIYEAENLDFYYVDGTTLYLCKEDGSELFEITNLDIDNMECLNACYFGEYYGIDYYNSTEEENVYAVLSKDGQIVQTGYGWFNSNYVLHVVGTDDDGYTTHTYFDVNLEEITSGEGVVVPEVDNLLEVLAPNIRAVCNEIDDGIFAVDGVTFNGKEYYICYKDLETDYICQCIDANGQVLFSGEAISPIGDHIFVVVDNYGTYENNYEDYHYSVIELYVEETGAAQIEIKEDGSANAEVIAAGTTDEKFVLKAAKDIVSANSVFEVMKLADTETAAANAKQVLKDVINAERSAVYDITLLSSNGAKLQPNGTLTITTAVPTGFDAAKVKVFRINDDNSYTELKSSVSNNEITFETDHFSTYVIAEQAAAVAPKTGDTMSVTLYLMLMLAAVVAMFSSKKMFDK